MTAQKHKQDEYYIDLFFHPSVLHQTKMSYAARLLKLEIKKRQISVMKQNAAELQIILNGGQEIIQGNGVL